MLVSMQFAPVNPADLYTARTGGMYGDTQSTPPFVAGHDGVGFVTKVHLPKHLATWQVFPILAGILNTYTVRCTAAECCSSSMAIFTAYMVAPSVPLNAM